MLKNKNLKVTVLWAVSSFSPLKGCHFTLLGFWPACAQSIEVYVLEQLIYWD